MTEANLPKQPDTSGKEEQLVQKEAGLKHQLSSAQVAMIALGSTIGTGLFLTSAISVKLAGPAVYTRRCFSVLGRASWLVTPIGCAS